jgi:hypothetical protein
MCQIYEGTTPQKSSFKTRARYRAKPFTNATFGPLGCQSGKYLQTGPDISTHLGPLTRGSSHKTFLNSLNYAESSRQLSNMTPSSLYSPSEASYVMISRNNGFNTPASQPGSQHGLGPFDPKHLQKLSRDFVNALQFSGLPIEKGYLRKLLSNTLQLVPSLRPSQIILLPSMVDWEYVTFIDLRLYGTMLTTCSRSDTGGLKGQLAIHTGSSALSFQVCSNLFSSFSLLHCSLFATRNCLITVLDVLP